jgi:DNA-binding MarR family transcriptional regulator
VGRSDSATDLRVKTVALTPRGRKLVERMLSVHAAHVETVMDVLSPMEQRKLKDLLGRLETHLDDLLAGGGRLTND